MAATENQPFKIRNQALERTGLVLETLRSMRSGGTVDDVRERLNSSRNYRFSIVPIRDSLKFLANAGLVNPEPAGSAIWWSAK